MEVATKMAALHSEEAAWK
jgi:hypothetical protein